MNTTVRPHNRLRIRPHRSVLYMPGSNTRALEKGRTLPADALILDLEDAVAPNQKEQARGNICNAISDGGYGMRELLIRANGFQTEWGLADMIAAATSGAHARHCYPPKSKAVTLFAWQRPFWTNTARRNTCASGA